MSVRQRQLDELHDLCRAGSVARAVDLAFEHFARFGPDHEVIEVLAGAVGRGPPDARARRRLAELRASSG